MLDKRKELWSTVGDMDTTADKDELQEVVNHQAEHGSLVAIATRHMSMVAGFYLNVIFEMAHRGLIPDDVIADYISSANQNQKSKMFEAWSATNGLHFGMNGLDAFVKRGPSMIAKLIYKPEQVKAHRLLPVFHQLMSGGAK